MTVGRMEVLRRRADTVLLGAEGAALLSKTRWMMTRSRMRQFSRDKKCGVDMALLSDQGLGRAEERLSSRQVRL